MRALGKLVTGGKIVCSVLQAVLVKAFTEQHLRMRTHFVPLHLASSHPLLRHLAVRELVAGAARRRWQGKWTHNGLAPRAFSV